MLISPVMTVSAVVTVSSRAAKLKLEATGHSPASSSAAAAEEGLENLVGVDVAKVSATGAAASVFVEVMAGVVTSFFVFVR